MNEAQLIFQQPMQQTQSTASSAKNRKSPSANMTTSGMNVTQVKTEAREEAVKEVVKQEETNKQKLDNLVQKSEQSLLRINSVFPFDFFPDRIIITQEKVSVIQKIFFFSESVRSVMGKDIANVTVQTNVFFATLIIIDKYFAKDPITIRFLKKREALEARRIIQGMIVTTHQEVDITKVNTPDIKTKLEAIGRAAI